MSRLNTLLSTASRRRALRRTLAIANVFATTLVGACSSDAGATEPDSPNNGGGGGTAFPTELTGSWVFGLISPTDFYNASTGEWIDNAYGTAVLFDFKPDGRYTQSILIKTSAYNCRMQVYIYNEGRAQVEGALIKVHPTKGTIRSRDSCNAANNYDRPDDIARKQGDKYGWTFQLNEDGKTYLLIGFGGKMSNPSHFRRVE